MNKLNFMTTIFCSILSTSMASAIFLKKNIQQFQTQQNSAPLVQAKPNQDGVWIFEETQAENIAIRVLGKYAYVCNYDDKKFDMYQIFTINHKIYIYGKESGPEIILVGEYKPEKDKLIVYDVDESDPNDTPEIFNMRRITSEDKALNSNLEHLEQQEYLDLYQGRGCKFD